MSYKEDPDCHDFFIKPVLTNSFGFAENINRGILPIFEILGTKCHALK